MFKSILNEYERLLENKVNLLSSKDLINIKESAIDNIIGIEDIDDVEKYKKNIKNYEEEYNRVENQSIFHYTSGEGLKSIIENKELWFSKTDFLNDRNEIKHTYELLDSILRGTILSVENNEELRMEICEFSAYLNKVLLEDLGSTINKRDSYSVSFSINEDSNLLWEGYSKDDGYNIEFNSSEIYSTIRDNMSNKLDITCIAHTVIYDNEQKLEILKEQVLQMYKIFKYYKKINELEKFEQDVFINVVNIVLFSFFFKSGEFEQEQEYRIILICLNRKTRDKGFNVRLKNGSFIPYLKVPIDGNTKFSSKCPIRSITIGPKNNLDIVENGLKYLLELSNIQGINESAKMTNKIKVNQSKIPYRY